MIAQSDASHSHVQNHCCCVLAEPAGEWGDSPSKQAARSPVAGSPRPQSPRIAAHHCAFPASAAEANVNLQEQLAAEQARFWVRLR